MDERLVTTRARPKSVFAIVERIGGKAGWYYGNLLWRLRGLMDRIMGGVGMRRGRRDPRKLNVGDPLDFWRVEELIPGRKLRLRAEMWVPGRAILEFEVRDKRAGGRGAYLLQRARFWPDGWLGWLYWYSVFPLHLFIFPGMAGQIVRRAERLESARKARVLS